MLQVKVYRSAVVMSNTDVDSSSFRGITLGNAFANIGVKTFMRTTKFGWIAVMPWKASDPLLEFYRGRITKGKFKIR